MSDFDLLSTVEQVECSANLPKVEHPNLMVGIEMHDDAGVCRMDDHTALIHLPSDGSE